MTTPSLASSHPSRDSDWIQTFLGRQAWPLEPWYGDDPSMEDIAHALSLTCRFTGHCREFYSVAQHSVLCAQYVSQRGGGRHLQMAALLHDGSEAYLPDVAKPIKHRILFSLPGVNGLETFSHVEHTLMQWIGGTFDVDPQDFLHPLVKEADTMLLHCECRDLMSAPPRPWADVPTTLWDRRIQPVDWKQAKIDFLGAYALLAVSE